MHCLGGGRHAGGTARPGAGAERPGPGPLARSHQAAYRRYASGAKPASAARPRSRPRSPLPPSGEELPQPPSAPKLPPAPANVVACAGPFAKDTTHLKLAVKYDSRNITFGQVDGPEGAKIPASILFPNDPKRRLEVLWINEASRSEPGVIAINGKSQWTAPKGIKLGLPLAALEKANGKPFKISGFDKDGNAETAGSDKGAPG